MDLYKGLNVQPTKEDKYLLKADYRYKDHIIPKDYITNGADIPRVFWSIVPPFKPLYLPAVIVHDYYCDKGEYKLADDLFEEMLMIINESVETKSMVLAVRKYHRFKYNVKED